MSDPLLTLREYAKLAPWNIRDLAALSGGILDASGVTPINAAAQSRPSDRTIRFYVTRHLMSPPEGRGTAATYGYRHLLQLLSIKLRQMEGATLATITKDITEAPGDVLEKRVASAPVGAWYRITLDDGAEVVLRHDHPAARTAAQRQRLADRIARVVRDLSGESGP